MDFIYLFLYLSFFFLFFLCWSECHLMLTQVILFLFFSCNRRCIGYNDNGAVMFP